MKTYIEISQPSTAKMFTNQVANLLSSVQATCNKVKGLSKKIILALVALLFICLALSFGCTLFALMIIILFTISLGMVINEFFQYIRFIRDME